MIIKKVTKVLIIIPMYYFSSLVNRHFIIILFRALKYLLCIIQMYLMPIIPKSNSAINIKN